MREFAPECQPNASINRQRGLQKGRSADRDLEFGPDFRYLRTMLRERIRRIATVVLTLALTLGLVTHSVGRPDFTMKSAMAAAASDMPLSGSCDGCGADDQRGMPAACAAYCGGVVALPVTAILLDVIAVDILRPAAGRDATGHVAPPD